MVVVVLVLTLAGATYVLAVLGRKGLGWSEWRRGHAALRRLDYVVAEACFRESVARAKRLHGERHWRVAFHHDALGKALLGQKRLDDAGEAYAEAMRIVDACGPQLPSSDLALVLVGAAVCADARGDGDNFESLAVRASRVATSAAVRSDAGRALLVAAVRRGNWSEAAEATARIAPGRLLAKDVVIVASVGQRCLLAKDPARAVLALRRSAEHATRHAPRSAAAAFFGSLLGEALAADGNDAEARSVLEAALASYQRVAGDQHVANAWVLLQVAEVRARLGDREGARAACDQVLAICTVRRQIGAHGYRTAAVSREPMAKEWDRAHGVMAGLSGGRDDAP